VEELPRRATGRLVVELRQLALEQLLGLGLEVAEDGAQALVVRAVEVDLVQAGSDGLGDQRLQAAPHVLRHGQDDVPAGGPLLRQRHPPVPRPRCDPNHPARGPGPAGAGPRAGAAVPAVYPASPFRAGATIAPRRPYIQAGSAQLRSPASASRRSSPWSRG